jgi:nicotinamidase-related amidase
MMVTERLIRAAASCPAVDGLEPCTSKGVSMDELDSTRAAVLALDFQNYGVHPHGYWATHGEPDWPAIARPAVENTARVLAAARRHRVLVIHVGVAWRPGSPEMNMTAPLFARAPDRSVAGTWGSEFYAPVAPAPGELAVYKRGVSALAGTELDRLLRLRDVNTLVLTGVATQFAVEGTAREAVDRGYRVLVLEGLLREPGRGGPLVLD